MKDIPPTEQNNGAFIVVYQAGDGSPQLDVRLDGENIWLTQAQLADLYHTSKSNVSEHIRHIFDEGELNEDQVIRKFRTTAADRKVYNVNYYLLADIRCLPLTVRPSFVRRVPNSGVHFIGGGI